MGSDMQNDKDCPGDEILAAYADGGLPPPEREWFERHLAACPVCAAQWGMMTAGEETPVIASVHAPLPVRIRPVPLWAACAAASLLLALATWWFWPRAGEPPRKGLLPEGRPVAGREESLHVARGGPADVIGLPDGSRFRVHAGSSVRFMPPASGERIVLEFSGSLEAQIAKRPGAVILKGEAAAIHVRGTAFLARSFRLRMPSGGVWPALSVEVSEGKVELAGEGKALPVSAGQRGIAWRDARKGDLRMTLQEIRPADWGSALDALGGMEPASPEFIEPAVYLWGSSWQGISGWPEAWRFSGAHAARRRALADLLGLGAGPEDGEILVGLFRNEPDLSVRVRLLPHAARALATEGRRAFLEETAGKDPAPAVREEARRLMEEGNGR